MSTCLTDIRSKSPVISNLIKGVQLAIKGYTQGELSLAVRQERQALIIEKRNLIAQLTAINDRLVKLDTAENLLEGEF